MKKTCFLVLFLTFSAIVRAQSIYICSEAQISFFSSAPIEDIEGNTDKGVSALNTTDGSIFFKVPVKSFQFDKGLMQQHFNSDYMESDQYPYAEFKGKILDSIPAHVNGKYAVTVDGELMIHGVTRHYTTPATIEIKNDQISAKSSFKVRLADHEIKIPRLLMRNIAEVVEVKVDAAYHPEAVAVSSGRKQ